MKIVRCTEEHLANFKPSKADLEEAKAAGIEPHIITDHNTKALLDESGRTLLVGGFERWTLARYRIEMCLRVWFVTSELVENLEVSKKIALFKAVRDYKDDLMETYDALFNYVHIDNKEHIRFLKALGANFTGIYSKDGKFQKFIILR